jgi:putative Mg2+ transporter-C (MgtC) family protein
MTYLGEFSGQGWLQIGELILAFVMSALIGLEREMRQKAAGLRTYTLVGFASALIMLVSKYGFMDILSPYRVVLDPSRIAAQIVSGIGFIGGGVIFVRRDAVRGLTTAATVWLVAAVGMACGAGLPLLAIAVTAGHFVIVCGFLPIERRLPRSRWSLSPVQISYEDGRGILRDIMVACTKHDFAVSQLRVERPSLDDPLVEQDPALNAAAVRYDHQRPIVTVSMRIQGLRSVSKLVATLTEIDGVVAVSAGDSNVSNE